MTKARDLASSGVTLTSTTTTADAALARAGGTMTGDLAMGTNLVDGVDVSARDAVLTSTTTTATAALPKTGGAMTGAITTNSTFDGVDIATRDAVLSSTTTTATNALNNANNALPKEGGVMTGPITTNSTFDGVDVGVRDSVLTSTTTTANAALPKAGGAVTGNVTFADNDKAIFGAGSDLQIYHNGTHSLIEDAGQGDLRIRGDNISLRSTSTDEPYINLATNGAVTLYHNNAAKLATTATGVAITGGFAATAGSTITSNTPTLSFIESDQSNKQYQIGSFGSAFAVNDASASAFRFIINTTGKVGIGVVPETDWRATDGVVQLGNSGAVWSGGASGQNYVYLSSNLRYDGSNFKYINTDEASYYLQNSAGEHIFTTAVSGSADANITFIENFRMNTAATVFNEGSANIDFRVESNGNANMIFVDAGNNHVNIGTADDYGFTLNVNNSMIVAETNTPRIRLRNIGNSDTELGINGLGAGGDNFYIAQYAGIAAGEYDFRIIGLSREFTFSRGGVVNEGGADSDFRVESDNNSYMLFVDAGSDHINIGTNVDQGGNLNVAGGKTFSADLPQSQLVVTDTTSMAAGVGGAITFRGVWDNSNNITGAASIESYKRNATSGNYGFGMQFKTRTHGGNNVERLYMDEGNTVFNNVSANIDFRVESDSNANMLFVDAGDNVVHIGNTAAYGGNLNVNGSKTTGSGIPTQGVYVVDQTNMAQGVGGAIVFSGKYHSNNAITPAGSIEGYKSNATDGNYGFGLQFKSRTHGSIMVERLFMDEANTVFNDASADTDFRVESNGNAHMLFIDGANNSISIGTNTSTNDTNLRLAGASNKYSLKLNNAYGGGTAIYANNTNNQSWIYARFNTNASQVGYIQVGTGSTAYSTSGSDKRLKKNFETWEDSELSNFETLKPTKFNWNTEKDGTEKTKGFIAQDLVDAFPEAYPLDEQSDRYFFNPSGMVVYLMKAMQESSEKIKSLEARITALES